MIKPRFTKADLYKMFAKKLEVLEQAMILSIEVIAEECVKIARDLRDSGTEQFKTYGVSKKAIKYYTDRSGNLRSSVGYAIYLNGELYKENFQQVSGGSEGVEKAKSLIISRVKKQGIQLIVVAGMGYARYVEAYGFEVLTPSRDYAEKELPGIKGKILKLMKEVA